MAVSPNTGQRKQVSFWRRAFVRTAGQKFAKRLEQAGDKIRSRFPVEQYQLRREDVLLTAIPLLFALALVAHQLLSVPYLAAVATGALLSAAVVIDALFLNPPVESHSS